MIIGELQQHLSEIEASHLRDLLTRALTKSIK